MIPARIMVVEDEFIVASDIQQTLTGYGYEIASHEASGEEALSRVVELKPDLVIMDVVLKGEMTGIEAAHELRTRYKIPVIFLTSYADVETLEKAKAAAPYGFLLKPFKDRELRASIETALYRIQLEKELATREAQLLDANRLLEAVFSSTDVLLAYLDRDFNYIRVNRAYAETGLRPAEDFVGKNHFMVYPDVENERIFRQVLESGDPYVARAKPFEHPDQPGGGTTYWDWSLAPVKDESGRVNYLVLTLSEVTDKTNFAHALQKAGKELQSIIDSVPAYIFLKDTENNFIRINQSFADALGISPLDAIGRSVRDLFPEDIAEQFYRDDRTVIESGQPKKGIRERTSTRHGDREFITDKVPLFDEEGRVTRILGVATDITPLIHAEQNLREARDRLQAVLDSIDAIVYVADMETHEILLVNDYTRHVFGAVEGDLCWKTFQADQTGPCDFCTNPRLVDDRGNPTPGVVWEFENTRNKRWYECRDQAIRWLDGRLVRFEVATDVTERRIAEQETQKMRNLESLGVLAGGIAHDFNNLLTTVLGNIELARIYSGTEDRIRNWLDEATKATEGARQLTNQLLTFSRGGAPVREDLSVAELVTRTCSFTLSGTSVRCINDLHEKLWPIRADRNQLAQVFHNIIMNAREAMPEGGTIRVRGSNIELSGSDDKTIPAGRYVQIEIEDTGCGIPSEMLPRVFDPYFSTKPMGPEKGTGMGLSICHSIIQKHGGQITLDSRQGQGTRVTLRIPAAVGDATTAMPRPAEVAAPSAKGQVRGRILFMEDEEAVVRVAQEMFRYLEFDVDVAREGHEAVEMFRQARSEGRPYDLVVLDLTIRGGLGALGTIELLRAEDTDVRAVISTGYGDDPVVQAYTDFGFKGVLIKPYRVSTVRNLLVRLLPDRFRLTG